MSKAKLLAYKVRPDDLLDLIDAADAGMSAAILVRCAGGRLIRDGYMCPHCGNDPSAIYNAKGEAADYPFKKGEKYHRKCGAPASRVIAKDDLTKLFPVHIEG